LWSCQHCPGLCIPKFIIQPQRSIYVQLNLQNEKSYILFLPLHLLQYRHEPHLHSCTAGRSSHLAPPTGAHLCTLSRKTSRMEGQGGERTTCWVSGSGLVIQDSFVITGTLKAQAGYTLYRIQFKVCRWVWELLWGSARML